MFNWLFKQTKPVNELTTFLNLPVGRKFKKLDCWDEEKVYVKTETLVYQTTNDGWHCPRWYQVTQDFDIQTV